MALDAIQKFAVEVAVGIHGGHFWRCAGQLYQPGHVRVAHTMRVMQTIDYEIERICGTMPKNGTKDKPNFEFKGFVNVSLTDEDKTAILENLNETQILQDIGSLTLSGYRLGLTWDNYSEAVQATLTCRAEEDPNYGYAISSRNPDIAVCLASLLYKHFEKCQQVWSVGDRPAPSKWD